MTNEVLNTLGTGVDGYVFDQASKELTTDVLECELFKYFTEKGIINTESGNTLGKNGGDNVFFHNLNRRDSHGHLDGEDMYSNAQDSEYGKREVKIDRVKDSHRVAKKTTMAQQRADSSVGDLNKGVIDNMTQWATWLLWHSFINQAAGNNATSIDVPRLASSAFNGAKLRHVTGLNGVESSTSQFSAIGNLGAGGVTPPNNITSANILTIQDFMAAEVAIGQTYSGITTWNQIMNNGECNAVALVSRSGWNQMLNQAPAVAANATVSQEVYSQLQGGNDLARATGKTVYGFAEYRSIFTPTINYVVVPDDCVPRAVHSSAAVSGSRSALILGAGAVDMAVGRMIDGAPHASFKIATDTTTKSLNDFDYYGLWLLFGIKRTQLNGFGLNAGNKYDYATYKIDHYTAS